jgi:pimeloyl-ACP methyl ester carboxylesterase
METQSYPCRICHPLAVYRIGEGRPVLFMPGPHRFQRPGLRSADALIAGLTGLGRSVITFDPPGSGQSTRPHPDLQIGGNPWQARGVCVDDSRISHLGRPGCVTTAY